MQRGCWSCRGRCRRLYSWSKALHQQLISPCPQRPPWWRVSSNQLAFNPREQIIDVIPLEDAGAQREQHLASRLVRRARFDERVPALRQLAQLALVLAAPGLDWRPRTRQPPLPLVRRRAARFQLTYPVEFLVQREDFLEKCGGHRLVPGAVGGARARRVLARALRRKTFEREQILDACDRILERPIRVVQVRGSLEARAPFGRRRIVEIIRMVLPAERPVPLFEIGCVDVQLARQADEAEKIRRAALDRLGSHVTPADPPPRSVLRRGRAT